MSNLLTTAALFIPLAPLVSVTDFFPVFGDANEAVYSPFGDVTQPTHKFSTLVNLSLYARYDGQFELYYVFDVDLFGVDTAAGSNFNHWVQGLSPALSPGVTGAFQPITTHIDYYSAWTGLALDTFTPGRGCAYVHRANTDNSDFFFAIGQLRNCYNGIVTNAEAPGATAWVQLWVAQPPAPSAGGRRLLRARGV